MPIISAFYGLIITMYWNDHNPPHFHVKYGDYNGIISIKDFALLEGWLPPKALAMSAEWASLHQKELMDNWNRAQLLQSINRIEPLN